MVAGLASSQNPIELTRSNSRIRNIFDGKAEQSSILHASPQFILLPDAKWMAPTTSSERGSLDKLYLLAISRPSLGIRGLRDLRLEHVPLLEEIKRVGTKAAADFGLKGEGRVRMFVHYQPSYCK